MSSATASIRELRTDFRAVKRKLEQHGQVTITDNGEPCYLLKPLRRKPKKPAPMPDYYGRMLKRQPVPISREKMKQFWEDERGDR